MAKGKKKAPAKALKKKPPAKKGSKLNRPPEMGQNFLAGMPMRRRSRRGMVEG